MKTNILFNKEFINKQVEELNQKAVTERKIEELDYVSELLQGVFLYFGLNDGFERFEETNRAVECNRTKQVHFNGFIGETESVIIYTFVNTFTEGHLLTLVPKTPGGEYEIESFIRLVSGANWIKEVNNNDLFKDVTVTNIEVDAEYFIAKQFGLNKVPGNEITSDDIYQEEVMSKVLTYFDFEEVRALDKNKDFLYHQNGNFGERISEGNVSEDQDVLMYDFGDNINSYRYIVSLRPKNGKGMELINHFVASIKDEQWLLEVNNEVFYKNFI